MKVLQLATAAKTPPAQKSQLIGIYDQCSVVTKEDHEKMNAHFSNQKRFNAFIGIVITLNAITIGLEVDVAKGDAIHQRLTFFLLDVGFSVIFLIEMWFRIQLTGWSYFVIAWNVLDYHLVIFSVVDILLSAFFPSGGDMKMLSVFRMVRMVRLVRNVRLLRMFRELWFLVQGFVNTLPTLFYVAFLELIIIFSFSLFTMMLIGQNERYINRWPDSQVYFGSVIKSIITLFQMSTLDGWADIVRPASKINAVWAFAFMMLIVAISFGVLHVIIASIVNKTLAMSLQNEKDCQVVVDSYEKKILSIMNKKYKEVVATASSSAGLNEDEFHELVTSKDFGRWLQLVSIPKEDVEEMFYLMVVEEKLCLAPADFQVGIKRIKGFARGRDMVQLVSFVQRAVMKAADLNVRIERVIDRADINLQRLDDLWGMTEANMLERECSKKRMVDLHVKMRNRRSILETLKRNKVQWFKRFL